MERKSLCLFHNQYNIEDPPLPRIQQSQNFLFLDFKDPLEIFFRKEHQIFFSAIILGQHKSHHVLSVCILGYIKALRKIGSSTDDFAFA